MMTVENILLGLIGIGCVWYLARKFIGAAKGEDGCNCSSCPTEKKCCCELHEQPEEKKK